MDFTTGRQTGKAKFNLNVATQVEPTNKINLGDRVGNSQRNVTFTELPPGIDMAQLVIYLHRLSAEMRSQEASETAESQIAAIELAKSAVQRADRSEVSDYLVKAGKWALNVATKIGVPVAVAGLKNVLKG